MAGRGGGGRTTNNNKKGKKAKNNNGKNAPRPPPSTGGFITVDPARVRFQHSRIRPQFSGCGRSVLETLDSIRRKEIAPEDLPPIQVRVIIGPPDDAEDGGGPWYFSLNNRRLWVLKRCRDEGLLENNSIRVRVRAPKSDAEKARYTVDNCALEAKIMTRREDTTTTAPTATGTSTTRIASDDERLERSVGAGAGAGDTVVVENMTEDRTSI